MSPGALIRIVKEDVIGSENTFHAWCVVAAAAAIIGTGLYFSMANVSFVGVAEIRESNLNLEYPVQIKDVLVLPGQPVHKGDLLVELNQKDLEQRRLVIQGKVDELRAELSMRNELNQAIGNGHPTAGGDPLSAMLKSQQSELGFIEQQLSHLYLFADMDGIVGSVNFKKGERAEAFAPIVTISPETPSFVEGYIHESLQTSLKVGSQVSVSSSRSSSVVSQGTIVSMGSRFVQIPQRIAQTPPSMPIWGRQVVIQLAPKSELMLGERVTISPTTHWLSGWTAHAEDPKPITASVDPAGPRKVILPPELAGATNFEASGALYLPDLKKYLVVSDDTDANDSPILFLVSESGEVDSKTWRIPDINRMTDMESISGDGDNIYIMTSLREKAGGLKKKTSLFVRCKRQGATLSQTVARDFGQTLRDLLARSGDRSLQKLSTQRKLEVESHSVKNDVLYIGLKSPQYKAHSFILRLASADKLFAGTATAADLSVWAELDLSAQSGDQRLSDFIFAGTSLYFTTTAHAAAGGAFWKLSSPAGKPALVRAFATDRPEGVAYNPANRSFFLTFDMGNAGSKTMSVPAPPDL